MPKGIYVRSEEIKIKMRLSHQKGWISTYKQKKSVFTSTGIPRDISKAMRGWSKWGGANNGFFTVTPEWHCQACKLLQTDGLPDYHIEINQGEFARICSVCYHTAIMQGIKNIFDLISLVRAD